INAVAAELASTGIAKTHRNEEGDYNYRSIEDVLGALAPLLAKHRLCVLPRVLSREAVRLTRTSQLTILHIAYDLISALDGSRHTIESVGEAIDEGDKGSAKAMSAAYKAAMLQAFAVPVPQEDSDQSSPKLNTSPSPSQAIPEPPEGWESWAKEVTHILASCETSEAIDRLLTSRRATLTALQKSRSELYAKLGEAIASRLSALQGEAHFHP
ncbi:MAG: ERF family protein, partial [Alphaproteobacteria bacterium]